MVKYIQKFRAFSLKKQGLITLASLLAYALTSWWLEATYALSRFPVPYFVQQTSFDAAAMKGWYASMLEGGTFHIYFRAQLIDFLFIASVIAAGFSLWTFVSGLFARGSFFHRAGLQLAFALPLAGFFDCCENVVSFFMLANPDRFADFLILPYSGFAVLKFGLWTIGLGWLALSLVVLVFQFIHKRFFSSASGIIGLNRF